ncbi:MAG: hypothetical protein ACE37D_21710 [Pseudomonadales bacterium]
MDNELLQILLGQDDLGVVIRAHIRMEENIENFLALSADFDLIDKMGLTFAQKLLLAHALDLDSPLVPPLKVLGRIRNKFAHRTNSVLNSSDVNNLYKSFDSGGKKFLQMVIEENHDKPEQLASKFSDLDIMEKFVLMIIVLENRFAVLIDEKANYLQEKIDQLEQPDA